MTKMNEHAPRPPSPTELSYSRLVQMTPFFNDVASKSDHRPEDRVASVSKTFAPLAKSSECRAPSTSTVPRKNSPAALPRSAPPASVDIPYVHRNEGKSTENDRNAVNVGVTLMPKLPHQLAASAQFQTPTPQLASSNSAGFANISSHRPLIEPLLDQNRDQLYFSNHDQLRSGHDNNDGTIVATIMSMENRVANLASKLQAMSCQSTFQQSYSNIHSNPSNELNAMIRNPPPAPSKRMQDIYQFIETLRNMQHVVSGTTDEQQRIKKSRALNALLNMFESVVNERYEEQQQFRNGNMDQQQLLDQMQMRLQGMEETLTNVQGENEQFLRICEERDEQIQLLQNELSRIETERNQLSDENERLRRDLEATKEQCKRERQRANQADIVASESDTVRNNILSNYGRLTEENLDLERAMEDLRNEKFNLARDLEFCREEVATLSSQIDDFRSQMEQKDLSLNEMEQQLANLNDLLAHKENSLQEAYSDRERIQNELFACHRNSNSTSDQLLHIQDKFSALQREYDSLRRKTIPIDSAKSINLQSQLRHEQQSRRHLEGMLTRANAKESSAQDQIRRLARTNAELKTKVNEMSARLSHAHNLEGSSYTDFELNRYNSSNSSNPEHLCDTKQILERQSPESTYRNCTKSADGLQVDEENVQSNIMDYIKPT